MNVEDLRTDSALGAHIKDGSTKYAQSGNSQQINSNKSYQDNGTNSLAKVDVQTTRPCAIIGPDRVLPSPNYNDGFIKKALPESWPCPDNIYRQTQDYQHKMSEYQPTRNISPRQTFQENMQRIMVTPYNSMKKTDDPNVPGDRNTTILRNVKLNLPSEVPYMVNPSCNEQKSVRATEIPTANINTGVSRSAPHGWPPNNVSIRPLRPYGAPELYQYPDYPSCAGPRPVPIIRPHRTGNHDEPGRMYPEQFYQDTNVRFRPYPPSKGRYPHGRYDYISNYSNSFHPPFPSHAFDSQKSVPSHSYPLYPQVPLKYIDRRIGEPIMDRYQRPSPQPNLNVTYRNPIIHPTYGPIQPNCIQNNMFPYTSDNSKPVISNKLPYANKIYLDYDASQNKKFSIPEMVYSNDGNHSNPMKGDVIFPNYPPINVHGIPQHPLYRKDGVSMKNFEYIPHHRNLDPSINFHNPLLRHPIHFSSSAIAISPSDSNTSNDTTQTHTTQEDCGYVSQSSTTSGRSVDSHIIGFPSEHHAYRSPDYRYGYLPRNMPTQIPNNSKSSKTKKDLNVRQFLQMWNEGDDDSSEQNKDETISKDSNDLNNLPSQYNTTNKQEQLYVLGLVNVPSEELGKYDHIQKISKLPENIKGYNNIELLNQFEEVIESSKMRMYNLKSQREYNIPLKSTSTKQPKTLPRPVSPLDVEAKISQSVIHKEVGCNFEIKPCSPKMLNVDIAAPIQNILDERIIEKVPNPISAKPIMLDKTDKINMVSNFSNGQNLHCEKLSKDSNTVLSCAMDNLQYGNDNISLDPVKQNYNLQYLEYNSIQSNEIPCLASLPRLDNDIELNFPEINQQFINANHIEPTISSMPVKDLPVLDSDQIDKNIIKDKTEQLSEVAHCTPIMETEKEFTKLSKYRKLKKTDSGKESQLSPLTKMQFRTDSVIIKNPDMTKMHETDFNAISDCSTDNNHINKKLDFNITENKITSPHNLEETSMTSKNPYKNNRGENSSNLMTKIDLYNIEEKKPYLPTDIALDFSLNKSDNEIMKVCPLKDNTESLLNFIDVDLNIPETYDKAMIASNHISHDDDEKLKPNEGNSNVPLLSDIGEDEIKNSFNKLTSESRSNIKSNIAEDCNVILPQKEITYNTDNITLNNAPKSDKIPDDIIVNKSENHLLPNTLHYTQELSHNGCKEATPDISTDSKESNITEQDGNPIPNKKKYPSANNDFETGIFHEAISEEQYNKQVEMSPKAPRFSPDIKCLNNSNDDDNSNMEFEIIKNTSQNVRESNVNSLNIPVVSNYENNLNENKPYKVLIEYKTSFKEKGFQLKKRLYSRIVQNLMFSEKTKRDNNSRRISKENHLGLLSDVDKSVSNEDNNNIGLNNDTSLTLQNDNTNNVKLGKITTETVVLDQSMGILDTDIDNSLRENNIDSVHDGCLKSEDDLNSIFCNSLTKPGNLDCASAVKISTCPELSNYSFKDFDTGITLSNNEICENSTLQSKEIDSIKSEEPGYKVQEEISNQPEHSIRRARLKRSLSDSALNIYSNDDLKIMCPENLYTIPRKRKKINPCEMMEPNLISENLCDIIQTNRRNSISTLYDEENVSFCILIDNSCVLTEENAESPKICLTELTDEVYENQINNNYTFATENVIFSDEMSNNVTCSLGEGFNTNVDSDSVSMGNDFVDEYTVDQHSDGKPCGEETWIEDIACIETVFSDEIAEDVVLDAPSLPRDSNLFEDDFGSKNETLIYNDTEHMEKIKYIYGSEMCTDDAELVETLYRTPQMDVKKTLIRRESHFSEESGRYYDNDSLEKVLSESNDKDEHISNPDYNRPKNDISSPNTLESLENKNYKANLSLEPPLESTINYKHVYVNTNCNENVHKSSEGGQYERTQYDIVHSCETICDNMIPYKYKNVRPRYSNSSSPEVSSTTSEEKSCGILLKITNCNGSISSQINEFNIKSTNKLGSKLSENKEQATYASNLTRKRPLLTKAAQKYIPPLKETIRDLKIKLPLPQHSLNKLKILKISKDKPKSDKPPRKSSHDSCKNHYPKKNKPKFEDVLKSIDEVQIKMHKEKNKKQKHSIPKVVIKKNENGAHYASTSNDTDTYNPDLTGRKWQPWVFIEKNYFVDKMALNKKVKAIFNHRKNTYVLAEKFRKYKSIHNAKFIITPPKLEDISSGKLKYTIRLKHNY